VLGGPRVDAPDLVVAVRRDAAVLDGVTHHEPIAGEIRQDAVEQGARGYARYVFSYRPKQAQTADDQPSRTMFEGVAICRMENGLIADYAEIANAAVGLHGMGFPPQRLAKFIAKQSGELKARSESRRHID